ncbi:protein-L-isoaspartate(D-aspartate) O-methyltransferase [Henriciella barbarensis]|uniref:protein-L-isoaspartate(D-aspartate) O-methyltransferase n=1 Tax=Henriciella barbarensis TaxID=86342 RepID=UPI0015F9B10F|nr:protein-L-isoaspartate(D-aspartate) O-methyltransferase [Henriciella barbarensis]
MSADPFRAARFILQLRQQGIRDDAVLSAMETVDRRDFVDKSLHKLAAEDAVLPLGCGQVLPKPLTIAQLLTALEVTPGGKENVLLVGVGSGYTAALLAKLAGKVWAVDRYRTLVEAARSNLDALGIRNVSLRQADGLAGWREHAPYDRILATGAVTKIPDDVVTQLTAGGKVVAPVAGADGRQTLRAVTKEGARTHSPLAEPFLPLVEGLAEAL